MAQFTKELLDAVRFRGSAFVSEMPHIEAVFDKGGSMEEDVVIEDRVITGDALVLSIKDRKYYGCRPEYLTIDDRTLDHLERCLEKIEMAKKGLGLRGRYRQGNTRNFTGSSYR